MSLDEPRDLAREVSPLQALRRNWRFGLMLCVVLGIAGGIGGFLMPVTYTAETRVAVGAGDVSTGAVPGYALGAQQLASNYARYVTAQSTGAHPGLTVAASPIPETNVIRIEVSGRSERVCVETADQVGGDLIKQVAASRGSGEADKVLAEVQTLAEAYQKAASAKGAAEAKVAAARTGPAAGVGAAQEELSKALIDEQVAQVKLQGASDRYRNVVSTQRNAVDLVTVRPAATSGTSRSASMQQGVVLGVALAFVQALIFSVRRERRKAREFEHQLPGLAPESPPPPPPPPAAGPPHHQGPPHRRGGGDRGAEAERPEQMVAELPELLRREGFLRDEADDDFLAHLPEPQSAQPRRRRGKR